MNSLNRYEPTNNSISSQERILMISETTKTSVILKLKKIFPKGHVNVLQGLPDQRQPERQAAARYSYSTTDCLQTVNQTLQRSPLSNPWRNDCVRSTSYSLTVHMGNIRGLRRLDMSGLWPRQSMEPCTVILTPESLLLMLNEDKWT